MDIALVGLIWMDGLRQKCWENIYHGFISERKKIEPNETIKNHVETWWACLDELVD